VPENRLREVNMNFLKTSTVAVLMSCGLLVTPGCQKPAAKAPPPPPTVTVSVPITREVLDFDDYTGRMAAVEEVEVRARVKGYLTAIGFQDGDEVKKNQLLFQIDPRPFDAQLKAAQGQVDQLKARKVKFSADVKRYEDLVPKGAATQQDLDKAIGELGEAEAGIHSAEAEVERARLELDYAKVNAPIDGMTSKTNLTVGNLIGALGSGEQLLTTIVRMEPMYVYFDVDQRAAQQYRKAALERRAGAPDPKTAREMNITFQFGLASETGFPHEGVIDFIDNKIDPATGTITVRGETKNDKRLFRPGFFARVRVAAGEKYQALLVAERAIGTQQGQKYVLVVDDKNTVAFRPVTLGAPQNDGLRVVRSGLKPGERIVVNGIQRARPGLQVKPENGPMLASPATQTVAMQSAVSGR
jgi:RND family efflux transporter MFP subunit